ncbi:LysM peptidoglycan-binding domain-containing protein [Blautia sp. MSJ-19]|uniref:LysM peptidoglycan-binding domain-containing protein n=1 Tax=Blautia sp. MSJ-19 TaxID=2841517 RepID=UPI001C0EECAA|nr:LysM peptidoglycan-binding domain-containing protein [Blautia sp. MSJ-19]MBU5482496.1 LysM peptidoglycan-binding domain-containing protein [Blautia sp. MSJ-19]
MIEVIYKDEKKETDGKEGVWNLPRNIRQVGLPGEECRIYIEDYVYTFLGKAALEQNQAEKDGRLAVLTGEIRWYEGTAYLFIKGALLLDGGEVAEDHIEFEDSVWQKMEEETAKYFSGQEVVGWFYTRKSMALEVPEAFQRFHLKHFGAEKVLMLMEPGEREEAFFRYENGRMLKQDGYYIYYEKNTQMQTYMLEKSPDIRTDERESVPDDAVKAFRKIIRKKNGDEGQETEEKTSVFSYAATACLALAVLTVGVQFYQNNFRTEVAETSTETISAAAEVTSAVTQAAEKVRVTPTSVLQKESTPTPIIPTATPVPEVTQATETQNQIYKEESDIRKAERRVQQSRAEQSEKTDSVNGSGEVSSASAGQASYMIRPGDTLYQISISNYGTMEKVKEICEANGISEDDIIYPGQIIVLP